MNDKITDSQQNKTEKKGSFDSKDSPDELSTAGTEEFEAVFLQGTTLLHQGRAKEAVPYLEQAFALDPDDMDVAINLGGAYIMTKKFNKAVTILEPASRQMPDHSKVWINLGAAYLGNPVLARDVEQEKAIFAFERALEIDPIAPSVAYNIGLVYRDRKETEKAIHWFHQAVNHDPRDKDALRLLRRLEGE
jgi:tetratricopeptide (TPR) repeat protein